MESTEPISFGDLTSVGDCHDECNGGCTEPRSATACFSCKTLTQTMRNKAGNGFKCVTRCEDTYYLDGDKCKMCSPHCHTCTEAEVCYCLILSGIMTRSGLRDVSRVTSPYRCEEYRPDLPRPVCRPMPGGARPRLFVAF